LRAELRGTKLQWKLNGSPDTIDHYTIYGSSDGRRLTSIADVDPRSDNFDLKKSRVPSGTKQFYLEAVGRASMKNHLVGPILYGRE
jgi:hypothetical protein